VRRVPIDLGGVLIQQPDGLPPGVGVVTEKMFVQSRHF
jgi:hypothetical protein